ncbi:MAG: DUF3291 domain-containing protein [Aggregatilineales bacterium]
MTVYHLAQLNHARMIAPTDDPRVADFMNALDEINALAEVSAGFVWRLVGEGNNATDIHFFEDPQLLVNMSVWESVESLYKYAYKSKHADYFARRREWFTRPEKPSPVLWWVPAKHTPTLAEALARVDHLAEHGPTPHAFNFKKTFTVEELLALSEPQEANEA